jgi:hypothetical protein
MSESDAETSTSWKPTRTDRYKMIFARDVNEAETRINALAREGYKFLAFQSVQGGSVYVLMEMDIDTLMDEVSGAGGFMSQG